jgi:hypothetical protein
MLVSDLEWATEDNRADDLPAAKSFICLLIYRANDRTKYGDTSLVLMLSKETPGKCERMGVMDCPKDVDLFVDAKEGTFHIILKVAPNTLMQCESGLENTKRGTMGSCSIEDSSSSYYATSCYTSTASSIYPPHFTSCASRPTLKNSQQPPPSPSDQRCDACDQQTPCTRQSPVQNTSSPQPPEPSPGQYDRYHHQ